MSLTRQRSADGVDVGRPVPVDSGISGSRGKRRRLPRQPSSERRCIEKAEMAEPSFPAGASDSDRLAELADMAGAHDVPITRERLVSYSLSGAHGRPVSSGAQLTGTGRSARFAQGSGSLQNGASGPGLGSAHAVQSSKRSVARHTAADTPQGALQAQRLQPPGNMQYAAPDNHSANDMDDADQPGTVAFETAHADTAHTSGTSEQAKIAQPTAAAQPPSAADKPPVGRRTGLRSATTRKPSMRYAGPVHGKGDVQPLAERPAADNAAAAAPAAAGLHAKQAEQAQQGAAARRADKGSGDQQLPSKRASGPAKGKGKGYSDVIGKTVDIPGRVFGVDIPDLYYRAVVRKKDPGHSRAVVVRTVEDNDVYWFPVDAVRGWLEAMATSGRDIHSGTVGEASDAYAAEVLSELISNKSSLQHQAASACRSDAFTSAAVAPNGCLVDVSQRHRDGRSIPPSAQGSPVRAKRAAVAASPPGSPAAKRVQHASPAGQFPRTASTASLIAEEAEEASDDADADCDPAAAALSALKYGRPAPVEVTGANAADMASALQHGASIPESLASAALRGQQPGKGGSTTQAAGYATHAEPARCDLNWPSRAAAAAAASAAAASLSCRSPGAAAPAVAQSQQASAGHATQLQQELAQPAAAGDGPVHARRAQQRPSGPQPGKGTRSTRRTQVTGSEP